jgi:hypothetical protein
MSRKRLHEVRKGDLFAGPSRPQDPLTAERDARPATGENCDGLVVVDLDNGFVVGDADEWVEDWSA